MTAIIWNPLLLNMTMYVCNCHFFLTCLVNYGHLKSTINFFCRNHVRVLREEASDRPDRGLQRPREARGQRIGTAFAHIRSHSPTNHRCRKSINFICRFKTLKSSWTNVIFIDKTFKGCGYVRSEIKWWLPITVST